MSKRSLVAAVICAGLASVPVANAAPVATYLFNGDFTAQESGVAALTPIDPLGANQFETATVNGEVRTVYRFDGNQSPLAEQAGLSLDTTGLISGDVYSVEMVFEFFDRESAWRRILDVSNRTSDNGFYVNPSNRLDVYPSGGGSTPWTNNEFHHVVLTNDGLGNIDAYFDGQFEFTLISNSMNFSSYLGGNPGRLMHLFADNLQSGGQQEFSDGRIAYFALYDTALTAEEVLNAAETPLPSVPEPSSIAALLLGTGLLLTVSRRRALRRSRSAA